MKQAERKGEYMSSFVWPAGEGAKGAVRYW